MRTRRKSGHAAPPRQRRIEHGHRPHSGAGRRDRPAAGVLPAQDPGPGRRGRRHPRPRETPGPDEPGLAQREVHRRLDHHRHRRDRDRATTRDRVDRQPATGRHRHRHGAHRGTDRPQPASRQLDRRATADCPGAPNPAPGTRRTSPRWRNAPAGDTRSSPPTSPGSGVYPARISRNGSTPCTAPTPASTTVSGPTRP